MAFYVLGAAAVVTALLTITRRNPMHSALFLVLTLVFMAGIFLSMGAEFVAAVQVMVYAGGVLILYLFVVMLMDLGHDLGDLEVFQSQRIWAVVVGVLFCGLILVWTSGGVDSYALLGQYPPGVIEQLGGNTKAFGLELFYTFVYPFEIVSLVLLVAMIGAVVLTRKPDQDDAALTESGKP